MTWEGAFRRFVELDAHGRLGWLIELLYHLSLIARATYEPGTDRVEDAPRLRRLNELIHRTTAQVRAQWRGHEGMPDDVFSAAMCAELEALGVACPLPPESR